LRFRILNSSSVLTVVVASLLAAAAPAPASSPRQDAAGTKAERRVVFPVTVVDKDGRAVEGLKAEDLRVTVEGAEQKVLSLSPGVGEPLHLVFMIDASASQESTLPVERLAAAEFASALMRPDVDDASVVSFTGDAEVVGDPTSDVQEVRSAIASVQFVPPRGYQAGGIVVGNPPPFGGDALSGSTAIWDSLVQVCDGVLKGATDGRRVVLLFTDGVDTSSRTKRDKAVERLIRAGVAVYSIGIGDSQSFEGVDPEGLRAISKRTGGRALFPKKVRDLAASLEQVRRELLAAYTVALAPAAPKDDGKLNRLHVEVVNAALRGRGVELAYPQGFYVGQPPPPARR
jgi:Ca-activated chloride channel homolog